MTATSRIVPICFAVLAALAVAGVGALMTNLSEWYVDLRKPSWQPPAWVFGPVWTTIYLLTATAALLAWWHSNTTVERQNVLIVLLVNAVLNVLWSLLFFRLRRPDWAFLEVIVLWMSIALLIAVFARRHSLAPWLLTPYLLWVSFAAFLNYTIVRLNTPFGGV